MNRRDLLTAPFKALFLKQLSRLFPRQDGFVPDALITCQENASWVVMDNSGFTIDFSTSGPKEMKQTAVIFFPIHEVEF